MDKNESKTMDLGRDNVTSLFFRLFFPTLLGWLSMAAVTAINGAFIGHGVGSDGLAAVNITVPLWMVFSGLGLMFGAGCSVVASSMLANSDANAAKLHVAVAFSFASAITIAVSVAVMCFPAATARLFGASEHLLPLVRDYLALVMPCFVFQMWSAIGLFIIRLDGAPKVAMWCNIITAILTLGGDYMMIYVWEKGLQGVAVSTCVAIVTGGLIAAIYILFYAKQLRFAWASLRRSSFECILRSIVYQCKIGSASLLGELMLAVLAFVGNYVFMRYLGDNGVGAFGIACYYTPFIFMISNAIIQSAQPIISYNNSRKAYDRVAQIKRLLFIAAFIASLLLTLVFVFMPDMLVHFFVGKGDAAAPIAIEGFPYFAAGIVFFILNVCIIGYFQSLEIMGPALVLMSLRGFALLVPAFLILPKCLGTSGIWLAMPTSEAATFLFSVYFLFRIKNKRQYENS
mgnify:FL=1